MNPRLDLDPLRPATTWSCNGDIYTVNRLDVSAPDGRARLRIEFLRGARAAGLKVEHTFDHWHRGGTVHINGQAWDVAHWAHDFGAEDRWDFHLERLPSKDQPPTRPGEDPVEVTFEALRDAFLSLGIDFGTVTEGITVSFDSRLITVTRVRTRPDDSIPVASPLGGHPRQVTDIVIRYPREPAGAAR